MIVITTTIVGSVLFYTYSTKLLGSFENINGPVTMDNLRIEAYNWNTLGTLILNVRNIGTNALNIGSADYDVGGVKMTPSQSGCATTTALAPGNLCVATVPISGLTASSGIVYVVKIVLSDGAIFSISAIAGQVTGQTVP
jgi:hypothetical protein